MDKQVIELARTALTEAQKAAAAKHAEFVSARKAAIEEHGPEALLANDDVFNALHAKQKEYGTAADAEVKAKEKYTAALDMLSAGDRKELGLGDLLNPEKKLSEHSRGELKSIADRYVESKGYKELVESGALSESGNLGTSKATVVGSAMELKALLTGLSDTSGGAFIVNDRQPDITTLLRESPKIVDLVNVGTTDSDMVEWVRMTSRTNAAAEVLEATSSADGMLPESTFALDVVNTIVQSLGHFIAATKRAMSDAGQLRTIIDQELEEGLRLRLDAEILAGNGTTPNLRGILNTAGIQTQALGADSRSAAVHRAITKVALAFMNADAIVLHPTDAESIRLELDANGNYIYGPPSQNQPLSIWGLRVVTSTLISAGTGLVGAWRQGATLWLREGVAISATDSHSDWFLRNIIAIKADMRCAFGVRRPAAFVQVTGL
jgi:HK97 family phage major capsid protein